MSGDDQDPTLQRAAREFNDRHGRTSHPREAKRDRPTHMWPPPGTRTVTKESVREAKRRADLFQGIEPADVFGSDMGNAPTFDADHFPGVIADAARVIGEQVGVDPIIPAVAGLAAVMAVGGDRHALQVKRHDPDWLEPARLWFACIAGPAHKKSPGSRRMLRPVLDLQKRRYREWQEAMAEWQKQEPKDRGEPPRLLRYLVNDSTTEALCDTLNENPHGVLTAFDEMSSFFGGMDAYRDSGQSKDRGFWLQAYEGGPFFVDRVKRGRIFVPNLSLPVFGHIQPDHIRRIAKNLRDDGLLQRFLVVLPAPGKDDVDAPITSPALDIYDHLLESVEALRPGKPAVYRCDPDALEALTAARREASRLARLPIFDARQSTWLDKSGSHLARLAMLFHLIERHEAMRGDRFPTVHLSTVERAIAFYFDYLLPSATLFYRRTLGVSERMHDAIWVAGWILAGVKERVTARDIARAYRHLRPKAGESYDGVRDVMEVLELAGWAIPADRKAYQPATAWDINPGAHVKFSEQGDRERKRRATVREDIAKRERPK